MRTIFRISEIILIAGLAFYMMQSTSKSLKVQEKLALCNPNSSLADKMVSNDALELKQHLERSMQLFNELTNQFSDTCKSNSYQKWILSQKNTKTLKLSCD